MGEVVFLGKLSVCHSQPLYGQRVLQSPTSARHFQRSHKGLPLLGCILNVPQWHSSKSIRLRIPQS